MVILLLKRAIFLSTVFDPILLILAGITMANVPCFYFCIVSMELGKNGDLIINIAVVLPAVPAVWGLKHGFAGKKLLSLLFPHVLVHNVDVHKSLDEIEFQPNPKTDYKVSCP